MDTVVGLESFCRRVGARSCRLGFRGLRGFFVGRTNRGWGGESVARACSWVSPEATRRAGEAGGDRGVVDVLKQLGGIPPSSLGARGEEDDRGRGCWAGWWAFAWAPGKSFSFILSV